MNRLSSHHDSGTGPKDPGQWGSRRQPLLQSVTVNTEFKRDPAKHLVGFEQQPVDGFSQDGARPPRPLFPLSHAVASDAQFVAVQLDHRQHTGGQHPLTGILVKQVFFARPLR